MNGRHRARRFASVLATVLAVGGFTFAASGASLADAKPATATSFANATDFCIRVITKGDTSPPPAGCPSTQNRSTPSGYILDGVRIDDYNYISPVKQYQLYNPSDPAIIYCQVDVQFDQRQDPATSKYWDLQGSMQTATSGVPCVTTWTVDYQYTCGVNITGSDDPTCSEYTQLYTPTNPNKPNPSAAGPFSPGQTLIKYFGFETGLTKFPMMRFGITFQTVQGPRYQEFKFRGHDTCVRSTGTKLCTRSDTGA